MSPAGIFNYYILHKQLVGAGKFGVIFLILIDEAQAA
jgi:hypothetical protein